nr:EamA family transporter RarD [Phytoactinopolyspora limicola]
MPGPRSGLVFGFAAYGLWGLLPLYWALLDHVDALEVLANRIVWSLVTVALIVAFTRRLTHLRGLGVRTYALLGLAGVIVTVNWATFIWAVSQGRVIETSLGYFINPLVTVLVAVIVLRERLRRVQWLAVGIAGIAVVVLTVNYGQLPWIGLTLALTFSFYSLIKKKIQVPAVGSVALETAAVFPFALGLLIFWQFNGDAALGRFNLGTDLLLIGTGVVTALPLLLFAGAARRASLTTLGLMQYLGPSIAFVLGITVFNEEVPAVRFVGFGLVWTALAILTTDALHHRRQRHGSLELDHARTTAG